MPPIPCDGYERADWLQHISDEISIAELCLPATHETLALYGFPISVCQTQALEQQLLEGIRFIDVRFAYVKKKRRHVHLDEKNTQPRELLAYHGIQSQRLKAVDVLNLLVDFVEKHPSEFVIVSIKQENRAAGFEQAVMNLIATNSKRWFLERRIPTLREARGKLVLFSRFGQDPGGIQLPTWPDNQPQAWRTFFDGRDVIVQDRYLIGVLDIPEKAAVSAALIEDALLPLDQSRSRASSTSSCKPMIPLQASDNAWRIDFTSGGSPPFAYPVVVAKGLSIPCLSLFAGVNERIKSTLIAATDKGQKARGLVLLMDFYDLEMVDLIITLN
ncbi:uncharacterized protein L969DRAFT_20169 [Mixia osmundae IAM 14324]|uniref:Phosphatidylinositol-specific phospholipase C X domain-containing protein n=1 Tax=Mixia osmundae (strain CBS 9802 / IAM 14324 / JCM 22182 / KY 12970) TaxID=764103 RepID=G7DW65_MIXOS|nr:uncharacterized protein L969DRAFT_20169 [Mixia osmundae IAM 14324]KEI36432.1 hypothetical protein L969DRAFT_20169 [Mixia osmundae IAM 14324]GAA94871.1 hypothetical protein E5Q_01525 [Mixia osmundae IAM 14324]